MLTRFFSQWSQIKNKINEKNKILKKQFLNSLIVLFFGFSFGNLFGTFISSIRNFNVWDGLIISLILLFCELVNYLLYQQNKRNSKKQINEFYNLLNSFKIGLLLGFFIDAFKVGS